MIARPFPADTKTEGRKKDFAEKLDKHAGKRAGKALKERPSEEEVTYDQGEYQIITKLSYGSGDVGAKGIGGETGRVQSQHPTDGIV